ncbi:MAG: tRNA (adenosine(37)-N6)-threonylcarbamoyltransferase complex ATPase subunit type 1 TsaE [Clostridia bacterium]|nr:tRNA (adenosine(37)-N6)-threonylcarbamoyltransferase complex ATPase subunit type 1 TsaE [Clostridia bacterium]
MKRFETESAPETFRIAEELASGFQGGETVLLSGDLGAGKTVFAAGLACGLGVSSRVTSPTFTVLNEYRSGRLPFFHFDLYRIRDIEELDELGLDEALSSGGVTAVEWMENAKDAFPPDAIRVTLRHLGGDRRLITIGFGREDAEDPGKTEEGEKHESSCR